MHLTPRETERLLIASAADLARRRLQRGSMLGSTEAIALACDEMLEAAWDGRSLEDVIEIGRTCVPRENLLPEVPDLVPQIQVEALFPHGSVLVAVKEPFGPRSPLGAGSVLPRKEARELAAGRRRVTCVVRNTGASAIWISSHAPLDSLNPALVVSGLPTGRWRLDQPAGISDQIAAGEAREVVAVEVVTDSPQRPEEADV